MPNDNNLKTGIGETGIMDHSFQEFLTSGLVMTNLGGGQR